MGTRFIGLISLLLIGMPASAGNPVVQISIVDSPASTTVNFIIRNQGVNGLRDLKLMVTCVSVEGAESRHLAYISPQRLPSGEAGTATLTVAHGSCVDTRDRKLNYLEEESSGGFQRTQLRAHTDTF